MKITNKALVILAIPFFALAMFGIGGMVGGASVPPVYLPTPDQEFPTEESSVWGLPINIDVAVKNGTIEITVTPGQVEGSFTVQEEQ